jgi:hypothetical protein
MGLGAATSACVEQAAPMQAPTTTMSSVRRFMSISRQSAKPIGKQARRNLGTVDGLRMTGEIACNEDGLSAN